jgi:hypothetical protein
MEISLWSVYAKEVTYTDSVIFSAENVRDGVAELSDRLFDYVSGMLPAWIRVRVDPSNAVVIIGEHVLPSDEAIDFTPGTVSVTAFADDHETFKTTLELKEGEHTDVSIVLAPLPVNQFDVSVNGDGEAALYDGALYVGKTPTKLEAPSGISKNLNIETPDGKIAQTVFRVADTPVIFDPKAPPLENRTDTARKKFYSAHGRFWLTLPLVVLGVGLNNTIASVYDVSRDPDLLREQQAVYWTTMGLGVVMGVFLAESFYRIGRYVWDANKEAGPLVRKPEAPDESESQPEIEVPPLESLETPASWDTEPGETADSSSEASGEAPDTP